jgi:hypothetical protein
MQFRACAGQAQAGLACGREGMRQARRFTRIDGHGGLVGRCGWVAKRWAANGHRSGRRSKGDRQPEAARLNAFRVHRAQVDALAIFL